ncbi:MAG: 50S ribosomal protein L6 [Kiritimatiellia bacterium]|nr:50S ribosomal protein L6 [Lentisphaerota bacterium]
MSRIGKKPVPVPAGVEVAVRDGKVAVKGPRGSLEMDLVPRVDVAVENATVLVRPRDAESGAFQGLMRSMIANMVEGVTRGYSKAMEIQGVGFKASVDGRKLVMALGYSSPVEMQIPDGVEITVKDNVNVVVSGADKQQVGDVAARIKSFYPAEPYKGKGVRFKGEHVRRKAGKTVA